MYPYDNVFVSVSVSITTVTGECMVRKGAWNDNELDWVFTAAVSPWGYPPVIMLTTHISIRENVHIVPQ